MNPMKLRLLVLYKYMLVRAARVYNFEEGNKIHELTAVDVFSRHQRKMWSSGLFNLVGML